MTDTAILFGKRYRVAEMNCGAFFNIGHITAAVPSGARVITLTTPGAADRTVRETKLVVFRKNPRFQPPADNDADISFLGVGDRAEVIGHPAFEPREGLAPTKIDWEVDTEG